jgi:DNA-binding MarR family transcriptional regulator
MITLTKEQKGSEIIKEFEDKYISHDHLEELYKQTGNNLYLVDLNNWDYFIDHPEETLEKSKILVTNNPNLSELKLKILDFIKNEKPESIRELSRMIKKDVGIIHPKIKEMEKEGLIELKEGNKNSKIPYLSYDKIEIAI